MNPDSDEGMPMMAFAIHMETQEPHHSGGIHDNYKTVEHKRETVT
jgi:hypothetical protein